jgi:hypothetical protein
MPKKGQTHTCCSIKGCFGKGQVQNGIEKFPKGLCYSHYQKLTKYGNPLEPPKKCTGNDVTKHPLYRTWISVKRRTGDPKHQNYKYYGGRGIKMCERWLGTEGFLNFVSDMGPKPSIEYTVDRINTDKDYSPENCRWVEQFVQAANKRDNNSVVGVSWNKDRSKWVAYISVKEVRRQLGYYESYDEAVLSRKNAEAQHGFIYPE